MSFNLLLIMNRMLSSRRFTPLERLVISSRIFIVVMI